MNYLAFFRANARFLTFGLLLAASASFGQTFFISLYMGEVRAEFGLGHGAVGTIYSVATLFAGMTMIWFGRLIDVVALRPLALAVTAAMVVSCLTMAWTPAVWALALAFYLLRLFGQGLMSHTAITGTLRAFDANRGKAVGIVSFGQPLGEAILPLLAVALVAAMGWRSTWVLYAGFLVLVIIPTIHLLLKAETAAMGAPATRAGRGYSGRQWTRREMLHDVRFWLMLPALLAPSYVSTGLIFHQAHFADSRGWSLALIAGCFLGYAAAKAVTAILLGPLVDRWTARRLARAYLVPLALSAAILGGVEHEAGAVFYLALLGAGSGASFTIINTMWAELYGVAHLGAIRSIAAVLSSLGSAAAPATMGWWIDAGATVTVLAWGSTIYVLLAMLPLNLALSLRR